MKNFLVALMCIFTISIGLTANGAPIDTSPDIECVVFNPSVDVDNSFTSVIDHPCFDPANVKTMPTSIEGVNFTIVILPDCGDPENPIGVFDELITTPTLASIAPNLPDESPDLLAEPDPCVTNTSDTVPDILTTIATLPNSTASNDYCCSPTDGTSAECTDTNGANDPDTIATDNADPTDGTSAECNTTNADIAATTSKPCGS